jgi:prepilin-type processing-associated H-X9-DG protein
MKKITTRILGTGSPAGFAVATTLALAPAAHGEASGSRHPGAMNFVQGDGSVRSISYTIDQLAL